MTISPPQASVMQFGLRGLVAIVTLVAIVAGVLSPWIRTFEPAKQQRILTFILVVTAGLIFGLMVSCIMRYRVEQRCGVRRCRLSHKYDSMYYDLFVGFIFTLGLVPKGMYLVMLRDMPLGFDWLYWFNSFMYAAFSSGIITWIWWRRRRYGAELCDNGIIFGLSFYPWRKFNYFQWNDDCDILSLKKRFGWLEFRIRNEDRSNVCHIVEMHLQEKPAKSKVR